MNDEETWKKKDMVLPVNGENTIDRPCEQWGSFKDNNKWKACRTAMQWMRDSCFTDESDEAINSEKDMNKLCEQLGSFKENKNYKETTVNNQKETRKRILGIQQEKKVWCF